MQHVAIPGPADIIHHQLPNGITVLIRENHHAQSVIITGSLNAGAIFEPPEKQGMVGFTASALMRGTATRDFATIHEALESSGASLHFGGNMHSLSFGGKSLGEDLPLLLELLADTLMNPIFPEAQVERLRGEILTSIKIRQQDTRYMAGRLFRQLAYPASHPYHRGPGGELETIAAITLDDLRDFHRQQFGPQNMIVIIVGDVNVGDAISQVKSFFGDWHNPDQKPSPDLPDLSPITNIKRQNVIIPGKSQADIILGVPGPSRFAEDYYAARLVNNIFGLFAMYGRLGKEIRENQGLAYYSYSQISGGPGPGAWRVTAGVDPANVERAIRSIQVEIERMINTPVDPEELDENQSNLTGILPLQLETNEGVATTLYNIERYNLGLDYLHRYPDIINSLNAARLQTVMARYWSPEAFALAVAGPNGS